MAVYADQNAIYTCPVCKGSFRAGNLSCLVAHPAGSCCHYGDTPLPMSWPGGWQDDHAAEHEKLRRLLEQGPTPEEG